MKILFYFYILTVTSFLYLTIFSHNGITISTGDKQTIDVKKLVLLDTNVYAILDSIIHKEQSNNAHFTDSTVFGVWIEKSKKNDASLITITGTYSLSVIFLNRTPYGFFRHRGYYFMVMTEFSELFHESRKAQSFIIDTLVEIFDDDRWPFHYIRYHEGVFTLL